MMCFLDGCLVVEYRILSRAVRSNWTMKPCLFQTFGYRHQILFRGQNSLLNREDSVPQASALVSLVKIKSTGLN